MRDFLQGVRVMLWRQLLRFARMRMRVVGSVVTPVVWLVFFGFGWSSLFNFPMARMLFGGLDYMTFLSPGILMMGVFMASFVSGVSVLWDKEVGFMRELLVAPTNRIGSIVGRSLGDAIISLVQGLLILLVSLPLAESIRLGGIPLAALAAFLVGLSFSSLGIFVALRLGSTEAFQVIMSLLMMPLMFLSGAFYPLTNLPSWMKAIAYANPMTYGVDLARGALTGVSKWGAWTDLSVLLGVSAALTMIAALCYRRKTLE